MNKLIVQIQQYLFISLGVFIPTSIAITNLIIGLISFCWIFEGNFKDKLQSIKTSKWILSVFSLMILYVLGMLWGDVHLNAEWQFQRLALLLVFPILATIKIDQKSIKYGASAFLITIFISGVIALAINTNIIFDLEKYIPFLEYKWGRSAFIKYNYHNVLLALSFTLCLYLIIENKTRYKNILILFIIVSALSIFTEKGRAGQVIFNLSAIFYIIYYNRRHILRGLGFFLLLFGFQFVIYSTTNVYKDRLDVVSTIIKNNGVGGEDEIEDFRYVVFRESLNKIFKKPFLGYGTGSFGTIIKNDTQSGHYFDKKTTPHNQYLYVWFELGIGGLFLLLMIFYHQIIELLKKQDGVHRILLPLSFMFLMIVDSYFFIFILTIAYIYLYTIYSRYKPE